MGVNTPRQATNSPPKWKILLAFAILYFVWGSTYLAIRVGVREVPPFLLAAIRFLVAGGALYGWTVARGEHSPTRRQWASASLLAILIFVLDYGLLFWAERRVPSGVAAVMMATIPVFMAVSEIVVLRTQRLTVGLALALLTGIGGVVLLRLPLPPSKVMSSGAQMLAGGVFLAIAAIALGELRDFDPRVVSGEVWFALGYLIVAGSIVAFTAYVWLIHHESPTKVGTYAYVNPVVAVLLGYFLGGEPLGLRTILGTVLILVSVLGIAMTRPHLRVAPQPRVTPASGYTTRSTS